MLPFTHNQKPKKKDYTDMNLFMRDAAAWAEANMKEWPWGGEKDEDDDFYYTINEKPHAPSV